MTDDDRLMVIDALRVQIHNTPFPEAPQQQVRHRWRRPRVLAGVVAGLAGAALAAAVVISVAATSASPAYAVTRHSDGAVTITLTEEKDRTALNHKLAAESIPMRVVLVVHGCIAPVRIIGPNHQPARTPRTLEAAPVPGGRGGYIESLTIYPPIDPDRTAVVAEASSGHVIVEATVQGPAPACVGDTPPPPSTTSETGGPVQS